MDFKSGHILVTYSMFTFRALDYYNNFEGAKPNDFVSIIKPKVYQLIKQKTQVANVCLKFNPFSLPFPYLSNPPLCILTF